MSEKLYLKARNELHGECIQKAAFELGYAWTGATTEPKHLNADWLFLNKNSKDLTYTNRSDDEEYLKDPSYKRVTLEDLYNMIGEFRPVKTTLNNEYNAVINKDYIQVGCQKITNERFEALMDAYNEAHEK